MLRLPETNDPISPTSKIEISRIGEAPPPTYYTQIFCPFSDQDYLYYDTTDLDTFVTSLKRRVLPPTPPVSSLDVVWKNLHKQATVLARRFVHYYNGRVLNHDQIVEHITEHYSGTKRDWYLSACDSLLEQDIMETLRRDFRITPFVKKEKLKAKSMDKAKARIIQCRGNPQLPRALVTGFALKNFESILYSCTKTFNPHDNTQEVAKELNPLQRASVLMSKINSISQPMVVITDCTSFDAHVNHLQLRLEKTFYAYLYKHGGSPTQYLDFMKWFEYQIKNRAKAVFKNGIVRYQMLGGRGSGDWNTAFGNVFLVCIMMTQLMHDLAVPFDAWRMFDDGDDCLLIVSRPYLGAVLNAIPLFFSTLGHEIKVDNVIDASVDFEQIEFCQSKPIHCKTGTKMVRSFEKMLATYHLDCRWFKTEETMREYYSAVGLCDLILYSGAPVVSVLAEHYYKLGGKTVNLQFVRELNIWRYGCIKSLDVGDLEITNEARLSFWKAYGLSPVDQLELENKIRTLTLPSF
jgi:hypothetical protein